MAQRHALHPRASESAIEKFGYRDVEQECVKFSLFVDGELPKWVCGTLYKQTAGAPRHNLVHDAMDGLAHISAFKMNNGKITFSNRYMRTSDYQKFSKTGQRSWVGVAEGGESFSLLKKIILDASVTLKNLLHLRPSVPYESFNPNVTVWLLNKGKTVGAQTEVDGEICVFDKLRKENMMGIVDIQLAELRKRLLSDKDITLAVTDDCRQWLAEQSYDPKFGARPLKWLIQRGILKPLSRQLLDGSVKEKDAITLDKPTTENEEVKIKVG